MRLKSFFLPFMFCLMLACPVLAQETPEAWLKVRGEELIKALSNPSMKTRQTQTLRLVENSFNAKELGRLAMGRNWVEFSEAQKERFSSLFMRYFVVTYTSTRLPVDKISFTIDGQVVSGKDTLLKTVVAIAASESFEQTMETPNEFIVMSGVSAEAASLTLIFALRPIDGGYYIRDIQVEGQSLLLFLRKNLDEVYKESNYEPDRMLDEMQEKIRVAILNANALEQTISP